jgi:hypothetical protein
MTRPLTGKYLVLIGPREAPRVLLFSARHDYLAELERDSDVVEDLIRAGAPCPAPAPLASNAALGRGVDPQDARCWQLEDW